MSNHAGDRRRLADIARLAMLSRDFAPDFSPEALAELDRIPGPARDPAARDLRELLWCSIDNDDSKDLDQLSACLPTDSDAIRVLVAVADVDAVVAKGSAIDRHARANTTSVYTPAKVFPMLPERLSTDLTSLNEGEERVAIVMDMTVDRHGAVASSDLYPATVVNRAQLAYGAVGAWLAEQAPPPDKLAALPELQASLRRQDEAATRMRERRHEHGALELDTIQVRALFEQEQVRDLEIQSRDRAKLLIEDLMIAANGVSARFLRDRGLPGFRRVVRSPDRWERIVALAADLGDELPAEPNSRALSRFLGRRRIADPVTFPDLSLAVVKLLGRGEYAVVAPSESGPGHFGLAVRDYAHSTAPNRRYPDLVTHRQLKAGLAGAGSAYTFSELEAIAKRCTAKENDADKVERLASKSAAACLLEPRIGDKFDAIVTGASVKGTWVRILHPPVEGKLIRGWDGLDVGDRLRVKLVGTDVERGYIDFKRA